MDLLEYQAKTLFSEVGIPVLPSQRIDRPQDLKRLKIPYPVVLKSQVRAGGRGKAGGIRFVENTIDAVAAAQAIFNLPILDEYPQVLLAEAKYNASREFYLAITLDPQSRRPILLGSPYGGEGMDEEILAQVRRVIVKQEFSAFYARHLAVSMGLTEELLLKVSTLIEKMYYLFVSKDLDLIEINPLGISPTGEVMALDGKVVVNSGALNRHPELIQAIDTCHPAAQTLTSHTSEDPQPVRASSFTPIANQTLVCTPNLIELEGNIGVLCNGKGLTLATIDAIVQARGKPALFANFGEEDYFQMTDILRDRLHQSLAIVGQAPGIKVILIHFLGNLGNIQELATEVADYLRERLTLGSVPWHVLRFATYPTELLEAEFAELPVKIAGSLEDAVASAIALAK
ncbi:MAG: succinate--CoA ligase subunit beta [Oscillatoriales cyanobacterium RM1_1_9]|nr:succinate--CoA ligase subunit beta [Oscillatoriales cyanobacterium SM2_3_0]NJO47290.1 succinate--CoA ligase subunit beta [Oscillatoriales cyanobacterium RM2_1_1]NJO71190.1 succinate--CoA ligase subunit beta [Oscillatoriales cyanobacterium RM1_1_9]